MYLLELLLCRNHKTKNMKSRFFKASVLLLYCLLPSNAFIIRKGTIQSLRPFETCTQQHLVERRTRGAHRTKINHYNMIQLDVFDVVVKSYSDALLQHPIITKGSTGFALCSVADTIAQIRGMTGTKGNIVANDSFTLSMKSINWSRNARFAIKGFFGALVWSLWYDISDEIVSLDRIQSTLTSLGIQYDVDDNNIFLLNILRTLTSMSVEQFIACPIIFSFFEIPAATILNNAPLRRIPYEISDKLVDMLVANAKVWTLANLLIYNVPVQFRVGLSNIIDILWQSIVSDFAADCGTPDNHFDTSPSILTVTTIDDDDDEREEVVSSEVSVTCEEDVNDSPSIVLVSTIHDDSQESSKVFELN